MRVILIVCLLVFVVGCAIEHQWKGQGNNIYAFDRWDTGRTIKLISANSNGCFVVFADEPTVIYGLRGE